MHGETLKFLWKECLNRVRNMRELPDIAVESSIKLI